MKSPSSITKNTQEGAQLNWAKILHYLEEEVKIIP